MKRIVFTIFLIISPFLFSIPSKAQNGSNGAQGSCYDKYVKVFEKRGAYSVKDGVHEGVVITVRRGEHADCFMGKAEVKDGAVSNVYLLAEDSTYKEMKRNYKHEDVDFEVRNGMTKTKVTEEEGELIKVLFVEHIKPKPKDYIRAPEPDFD